MSLTLLVLAAGMGSRYGGLKQLDGVGPSGETILDYAIYDALQAGFDHLVFVIRREFEPAFRAQVAAQYAGRARVSFVFQDLAELPPGYAPPPDREKPWGTAHAVWCAKNAIDGPFAVIGADDFFGRDAFVQLAHFLRRADPTEESDHAPAFALVGYRLDHTLSEHGTVSRGVCALGPDDRLASIVEHTGITPTAVGPDQPYQGNETVSMNCWAFLPVLFPALDEQLMAFLEAHRSTPKSEFYLPEAVSEQITTGLVTVEVLPTSASWFGVTYRQDKPRVQTLLADLVAQNLYPSPLFPPSS